MLVDTIPVKLGVKWSQVQILSARHRYRLCVAPSQTERIAEPFDRGAGGVVAGVAKRFGQHGQL